MKNSPLFIGIDLGTSAVRAMAIDMAGAIAGQTSVTLPVPDRDGPEVVQEARLWWEAVMASLEQLTATIHAPDVSALAVDGTSATLLLTDDKLAPLGPALMYNDARSVQEAEIISRVAPANTAAQGASSALAKLIFLHTAGHTDRASHALHQADWIAASLRHEPENISDANNALKLGYDPQQSGWPEWMLELLNNQHIPRSLLPKVVRPGTVTGTINPDIAAQLGWPATVEIVAGTTDSTASFIATGACEVGDAVTVLGSTLVIKVISDSPVFSSAMGVYSHPLYIDNKQRWLVGGASNSGGAVLRQYFSRQQINDMMARLDPDTPTGLEYYPLPSRGERFPINDPGLAPQLEPRPDDDAVFFQALLEGMARIEAKGYESLAELGAPYPGSIRTTGGGAVNMAWKTIRQRYLKDSIVWKDADQTEAAYGTALLARQSRLAAGH